VWVRKGFAEFVLLVSREVQWLAADHGWLAGSGPAGSSSGRGLGAFWLVEELKMSIALNLT